MVVGVGLQLRNFLVGVSIHGYILGHVGDGVDLLVVGHLGLGHLGVGHLGEAGGGGDRVP